MPTPAVTVILTVFNGEPYLNACIDSIRQQTFTEFEFIIADDASTDATPEILRRHAREDNRITLLTNERNLERSISRNRAIRHARSDLIAIMDADDIALPDRLEKQVAFMRNNPAITACGGALQVYERPAEIWLPPLDHDDIRALLLFGSAIYHPTAIFRTQAVLACGGYDPSLPPAEDYGLWARLAMLPDTRLANLPDVLLRYRVEDKSPEYRQVQQEKADLVKMRLLQHLGLTPSHQEVTAHSHLHEAMQNLSAKELWICYRWLIKLWSHAVKANWCSQKALRDKLLPRWERMCVGNTRTIAAGPLYFHSGLGEVSWSKIKHFVRIALEKYL